jgi:hypothetical protein
MEPRPQEDTGMIARLRLVPAVARRRLDPTADGPTAIDTREELERPGEPASTRGRAR